MLRPSDASWNLEQAICDCFLSLPPQRITSHLPMSLEAKRAVPPLSIAEHQLLDRKPRAASATQGYRLSAAQTVSSSGFTSFGFLVSGFGRSGCGLGRGRSITDFGSSPVRAFFIAHFEKNRSSWHIAVLL
jgi:hypothetical protein